MQNLIPSLRAADNAKKCGWPTRPESMKFCSGSFPFWRAAILPFSMLAHARV